MRANVIDPTFVMNFTRFAELVLTRLYDAAKGRRGNSEFIPVEELVPDVLPHVDPEWQWQVAQHLAQQGLALAARDDLVITPAGRVYVEREQGSGLIREYRRQEQIVIVLGDGNQVAVGHGQTVHQAGTYSKEEILETISEAEARVVSSDLPEQEKLEALADLSTIKAQMGKANPNSKAIEAVLPALQSISVISDLAEKLHRLLT
jgi:hypothetical protein